MVNNSLNVLSPGFLFFFGFPSGFSAGKILSASLGRILAAVSASKKLPVTIGIFV